MRYFILDHLGSVSVVMNESGGVVERNAYDAWGRRRVAATWADDASCSLTSQTSRGFTGHEQIDAMCLVNMNARIYDPTLGRFLSADSEVPDMYNGAALNRYAYVIDNPLSFTDPTGHTYGLPGDTISFTSVSSGIVNFGTQTFAWTPSHAEMPFPPDVSDEEPIETVVVTGYRPKPHHRDMFEPVGIVDAFKSMRSGKIVFRSDVGPVGLSTKGNNKRKVTNNANDQCIKATDGPVYFSGGGYDQVIGIGVGIQYEKWWIPSTGAKGTAVTGGGYFGIGANLGASGGQVRNFGDFNGDAYRFVAETPIPYVGGEALWNSDKQAAGGGVGGGAGGGIYIGKTKTTIISSNMPICKP